MSYIGKAPGEHFTSFQTETFSVSATTSYTLSYAVANENELALFINNVRQQPGSGKAYTASGTALTLSAATASTDTMYAIYLGRALQTITPSTNSITSGMLGSAFFTGATDVGGALADADLLLIDDGAGGTLRKTAMSRIKTYVGGGKIGQVVSTNKTDTYSASIATEAISGIVTGLTVDITPAAATSKILVFVNVGIGADGEHGMRLQLFRDTTQIDLADASSSRPRLSKGPMQQSGGTNYITNMSTNYLDSPSSTSALTYGIKIGHTSSSTKTCYVNRAHDDSDDASYGRNASTITVMEVLA